MKAGVGSFGADRPVRTAPEGRTYSTTWWGTIRLQSNPHSVVVSFAHSCISWSYCVGIRKTRPKPKPRAFMIGNFCDSAPQHYAAESFGQRRNKFTSADFAIIRQWWRVSAELISCTHRDSHSLHTFAVRFAIQRSSMNRVRIIEDRQICPRAFVRSVLEQALLRRVSLPQSRGIVAASRQQHDHCQGDGHYEIPQ